jgi:transposase
MDTIEPKNRTRVRAYPPEFKERLVAESQQPGASVAKVALAHGLNANMLHTWRREARGNPAGAQRNAEFVPLPLAAPVPSSGAAIRIELRQGATSIAVAGRWRQPTLARPGCASCFGDPHRCGLAGRAAAGHARRH